MTIENDRQLNTAIDFLHFVKAHTVNANKDRVIHDLIEENEALKKQVSDLEREIRVSHDLLAVAGRCEV